MADDQSSVVALACPERVCPVCDGTIRRVLFRQRFFAFADVIPTSGYDLAVCDGCGFAFADRIPDQARFDAYYREMSKYEYSHRDGLETEHDTARFAAIADSIIPRMSPPDGRVLDVGCATGGLLATMKSRGCHDVLGLDPSPGCAEAAGRLHGIRVLTGTVVDIPVVEGQFDVLILIGVLEHVRDFATFLDRIRGLTTPGGIIYVEVPDASNFSATVDAPFQEFSVEHINYFSEISLGNLMRRHGMMSLWSERVVRQSSPTVSAPTLAAICRADGCGVASSPAYDDRTEAALLAYIERSRAAEVCEHRRIDDLARRGWPIIVWGVGTHTLRLLATSRLGEVNVVAYVDSSPKVWGRNIRGVPVLGPTDLAGRVDPIMICSWGHRDEIRRQIREFLRMTNPIVDLFE